MENFGITDGQITSSTSFFTGKFQAEKGRLNHTSNWAAGQRDTNPWIQVDLLHQMIVTGIITQGSVERQAWVKYLQIQYGESEDVLEYISENCEPKVISFIYSYNI